MGCVTNGCSAQVREWCIDTSAQTHNQPIDEDDVVSIFATTFKRSQVQSALSYLSLTRGELTLQQKGGKTFYVLTNEDSSVNIIPPGYIGILLDDEKVILTVEGKTLEMRPAAFAKLRVKLKQLD